MRSDFIQILNIDGAFYGDRSCKVLKNGAVRKHFFIVPLNYLKVCVIIVKTFRRDLFMYRFNNKEITIDKYNTPTP